VQCNKKSTGAKPPNVYQPHLCYGWRFTDDWEQATTSKLNYWFIPCAQMLMQVMTKRSAVALIADRTAYDVRYSL